MSKCVYVGPTINGVAARNTVYEDLPEGLTAAISDRPYLAGLCVPIHSLSAALRQIAGKQGSVYTLYSKAQADSANIEKGVI